MLGEIGLARVFPRKTSASPDDRLCFFDVPNKDTPKDIAKVHISTLFTYDIERAEHLYKAWSKIAPTEIGGPAFNSFAGDFTPGLYLKKGYVITSRGCPNNCWFCSVHKREGGIRELPITEGWNLLDSNILACSETHVQKVFKMMKAQPKRAELTGGLEAKIMTSNHIKMLWDLRPKQMFFAYDTPDDLEPLTEAGRKLMYANFTRSHLRCYVLIGYPKDTIDNAYKRLIQTWKAGFLPMAMLWKNKTGDEDKNWRRFQREWTRPAITRSEIKKYFCGEK